MSRECNAVHWRIMLLTVGNQPRNGVAAILDDIGDFYLWAKLVVDRRNGNTRLRISVKPSERQPTLGVDPLAWAGCRPNALTSRMLWSSLEVESADRPVSACP